MMESAESLAARFFADVSDAFLAQKKATEKAVAQLADDDLFVADGPDSNSVAVLMKHIGGNLRSRWMQPFETDGEKPDRNRDSEFEAGQDTADSIRAVWDAGWAVLEETLTALRPTDIEKSVRVRGEEIPLMSALQRSLTHTAQHVGQIILLARRQRGSDWQTLSIPRGESARYLHQPPA